MVTAPVLAVFLNAAPAAAPPGAPMPAPWPPVLGDVLVESLDHPDQALARVRSRWAALDPDNPGTEGYWLLVAASRLEMLLEDDQAAAASLAAASRALATQAQPSAEQRAWHDFMHLRARMFNEGGAEVLQAMAAARRLHAVAPGTVLACEFDESESWLLRELGSLDEAWRASESLEACSAASGWPHYRATALADRAHVAAQSARASPDRIAALFEEAYAAVGHGEARFQRSLIAYTAGTMLTRLERHEEASIQLARALAASRALGDRAGIAAALTVQGQLDVARGQPAQALVVLDEAEPLLRGSGTGTAARMISVYGTRLMAMTTLGHPALAQTLSRTLALPEAGTTPWQQASLARIVAAAQAALGRHDAAYASMLRAHALDGHSREVAASAQLLRLQALYDDARRAAELAALRHGEETARLSLAAQQATARNLWLALAAATGLGTAGSVFGWRLWARRRELVELAMRDTLTGLPNRRAIEAYARAQLAQARRLSLPFTLALIDHDHFKEVNDRYGHAVGDNLLRAFASAAPNALRSPDRVGRWGGEEFVLVLPGTAQAELPAVFARLRAAFASTPVPGLPQPHGRTFSMGVAGADRLGTLEELVVAADEQLYRSKADGRDRMT